jgi:catechol 2,3-dioxygenase-like lactoylglutathione lyase family enzyme
MSHLTGLNHVAIITTDLDRFVAFYTKVFDMEVVFGPGRLPRFVVSGSGRHAWRVDALGEPQPGRNSRTHSDSRNLRERNNARATMRDIEHGS